MRSTIKDVATAAGVSVKTVSRVLNKERYVRPDTRLRVERAVEALNFRPSIAARTLGGRRSFQVALLCDNPNPYFVYAMQEGVRARCAVENVRMIAQPYSMAGDDLLDLVGRLIDETRPDGLILTPPITDCLPVLEFLTEQQMPFVRISPGTNLALSSSVFIDNKGAAHAMTAKLIAMGHRRIAFIVGDSGYASSNQRFTGYVEALNEAGVGLDLELVRQGRFDFRSGAQAAAELLSLPRPPTAIFAGSDDMAAGALATAHDRGIVVPDDLSIAGFDDSDVASIVWPPLTTVRQPMRDLAYAAADLLFKLGDGVERRELPFELILRQSAAPPRPAEDS